MMLAGAATAAVEVMPRGTLSDELPCAGVRDFKFSLLGVTGAKAVEGLPNVPRSVATPSLASAEEVGRLRSVW